MSGDGQPQRGNGGGELDFNACIYFLLNHWPFKYETYYIVQVIAAAGLLPIARRRVGGKMQTKLMMCIVENQRGS